MGWTEFEIINVAFEGTVIDRSYPDYEDYRHYKQKYVLGFVAVTVFHYNAN